MAADRRGLVKGPNDSWKLFESFAATTRSLDADDIGKILSTTAATAVTFTLLNDATVEFPIGGSVEFIQSGAGVLTIAPGAGVTLNKAGAFLAQPTAQHARIIATKTAANTWNLGGTIRIS